MKFFHVYNETYFEGLEKNGLINDESGFKIQHVFALEENMKFNRFAAKGTKLHSVIKGGKYPFYVDRIAGGVTYHKYLFDKALIREYKALLGDWFLGFQLHESGNNRALDWQRVYDRMEGSKGPYDAEVLASRSIRENAVTPTGEVLFGFSQGSPEEYAALRYPETPEAFVAEMTGLFQRRMEETDGIILPCDSYYLFTKIQNDLGMNTFMPEVGCQIPHMRIAVALARGMALANKKCWGVYYECWRATPGVGYTMPCFNKEPGNEWYLTQQTHPDDFTSYGPNGGSSRLLQKRIYYYALMSGARYLAEEWGLNCSYSNMNTFELSEYGEVKKEFINYSLDYRNMEAQIPFAIVLPSDYPCIQLTSEWGKVGQWRTQYLGRNMTQEQIRHYGKIEDVLKTVFFREEKDVCGNEGHVLQNSRFGDLFDIIYEDASEEVFAKYDCLIDASDGSKFSAHWNDRFRILNTDDVETFAAELERMSKEILPCTVDTLHWMLSYDEKGRYVTIFNNEGNERDLTQGDMIHHEADAVVKVSLKRSGEIKCIKSSCEQVKINRLDDTTYTVEIPAAEFVILQY
jgi:hypothetical protein